MYLDVATDDLYQKIAQKIKSYFFLACILLEQTRYFEHGGLVCLTMMNLHALSVENCYFDNSLGQV